MIPVVNFSADSASMTECAVWLAQNTINGKLVESAKADLPAAHLVVARTINGILVLTVGPHIWTEDPNLSSAINSLAGSLNVPSVSGGLGGGVILQMLLSALIKFLLENFTNGDQ